MRIAVLCAGPAAPHAGWAAIDELADLLAHYFEAPLLSPSQRPPAAPWRWLGRGQPRWVGLGATEGDVLLVVAHGPEQLAMVQALGDVRRHFQRVYGWVTDSYHQPGFGPATALYDAITVTAVEDADFPRQRFGVQVHPVYQGVDALRWAPRQTHARDIDLIAYGRNPPSYHAHFSRICHAADSPLLYLHSPLGALQGPTVHLERGMLFKLLHRSRISLAFHLFVEPQGQRPRSMMVTSRWLESLLAGCLVAGKRPRSRMAEDMLDWPDATLELADDPAQALDQLRDWLAREADFRDQRRLNTRQVLLRHDWRYRLLQLCQAFQLPVPPSLQSDLALLEALALQFR
ncbi:glycosyltransferase family 1 protein [Mitsuaria sp. WAJ17]|uniref:glycosyltransferase n=1 Tax=Mitsuaria sp. WAJ17 TaxID=2761452 RepID=UPI0015FFCE14|nr:glycosyltransferase [Mitsuaria sp. WAJ17]MBB2487069.1 glycosyltransferase family 1 protein [Mitsuaria sp. WAJ17]